MEPDRLRDAREILGHKWDLRILRQLAEESHRYMELARAIRRTDADLTDGVLSECLSRLTARGIINKRPVGSRRHVYELTARGRLIAEVMWQISNPDDEQPSLDESPDEDESPGEPDDHA